MKIIMGCSSRRGRWGRRFSGAFTLVELLLTVVLLLLLLGAVVFNYSSLSRGARLDHGAEQLETLFRFARSQAASSGRQVRIVFNPSASEGSGSIRSTPSATSPVQPNGAGGDASVGSTGTTNSPVAMVWEPDPYGAPGQFIPLAEARSYLEDVLDSIDVIEVRLPGTRRSVPAWGWNGYSAVAEKAKSDEAGNSSESPQSTGSVAGELPGGPVQVAFYPDGSSDSFEVIIGSQEAEDSRRLLLSLAGVTGRVQRRDLELDPEGHPVEDITPGEQADARGWAPGIHSQPSPTGLTPRPVAP